MQPDLKIIALEREILATRVAAAKMIAAQARLLAKTEGDRDQVVLALANAEAGDDPPAARLARLAAALVRGLHP